MQNSVRHLIKNAATVLELGYRIVRGVDYRTLSQYILKINQHKEIDAILYEASRCLKDLLDYELFGFALQGDDSLDVWVDPRVHCTSFTDFIIHDFESQNNDLNIHYIDKNAYRESHYFDEIEITNLISYKVIDNSNSARLYLQPRRRILVHHDKIIHTIITSIRIALEKKLCIQQLENAAAIDPLTNCFNRRAMNCFIDRDIAYSRRNGHDLSAIMIDVDNFKEINDVYGHAAGDAVLKNLCLLLPSLLRKSDYLGRYGGEEFVLVLPNTSLNNAVLLADKLRKKLERHEINIGERNITITASFGVASLENKPDGESLLREADQRMYQAKAAGKNTVYPSLLPFFADKKNFAADRSRKYAAGQAA